MWRVDEVIVMNIRCTRSRTVQDGRMLFFSSFVVYEFTRPGTASKTVNLQHELSKAFTGIVAQSHSSELHTHCIFTYAEWKLRALLKECLVHRYLPHSPFSPPLLPISSCLPRFPYSSCATSRSAPPPIRSVRRARSSLPRCAPYPRWQT